jgi:Phosphoenolpyruvate synthase/pyruvate phosphate dikinase
MGTNQSRQGLCTGGRSARTSKYRSVTTESSERKIRNPSDRGACRKRHKSGKAKVIDSPSHADELNNGDILVVDKLDERWNNLIEKASAVVANRKINLRQTRELLNEVTPVLAEASTGTSELISGEEVTVECSASKGTVWKGELAKTSRNLNLENKQESTEVYLDISDRERVFRYSRLPVDGARITDLEGLLTGNQNKSSVSRKSKKEYVKSLKSGISRVCAAFHPRPVTAELSRAGVEKLLHDSEHGTSSQIELEIKAIERCIAELGFENLEILLPPVATVETARELKSKILEIQSEIENVGFHASVESPEYVTHSEELLQEFQGLDLKTENLIENMKGGLSETKPLDTDKLLQNIIRQTRAQAHQSLNYA